jgi:hypothetical protein
MSRLTNILKDPVFWKAAFGTLLFFLFIWTYVKEFDHFNLMFRSKRLVIPALLIGGSSGLILGLYLQRAYRDTVVRLQIVMACLFALLVVAPLLASVSNRLLSRQPLRYEEVEFVQERAFFSSRFGAIKGESQMPTGFYLFFYYEGRLMRISLEKSYFETAEDGDLISIPVKKGFWGIDFMVPSRMGELAQSLET